MSINALVEKLCVYSCCCFVDLDYMHTWNPLFEFLDTPLGIIRHMLILATPSSTVNNTKYWDPYHWNRISFSCLFFRQWWRDVASGADRHLDITFGLHLVESSSHVSVLFREAFNHPYISFFHLLVTVFSFTFFRTVFAVSLPSFNWWAGSN